MLYLVPTLLLTSVVSLGKSFCLWASGTEVTIKRSTLGGKKMSELKGHMLNFLRLWDSELYYRSYLWKILKYIPGGKRRELMY